MPRSFDDHLDLYEAFVTRVSTLSPAAWERLAARCADLEGSSFKSLIDRARVFAQPFVGPLREGTRDSDVGNAITSIASFGITGLGIVTELAREVEEIVSPASKRAPVSRKNTTGSARNDRYVDAAFLLENTLAPREREHPGVTASVRAGAQAVLRHDWMSSDDFAAAYRVMESEIPFASLTRPPALPPGN